jgi:hypothetical protein
MYKAVINVFRAVQRDRAEVHVAEAARGSPRSSQEPPVAEPPVAASGAAAAVVAGEVAAAAARLLLAQHGQQRRLEPAAAAAASAAELRVHHQERLAELREPLLIRRRVQGGIAVRVV